MRIKRIMKELKRRRIGAALFGKQENIMALTGVSPSSALLKVDSRGACLYTDFRYFAEIRRKRPDLEIGDLARLSKEGLPGVRRIGYEADIAHSKFLALEKANPNSRLVEVGSIVASLRAVKTKDEIAKISKAERLTVKIWREASSSFRPGMTEIDMARKIRSLMAEYSDGEAFNTIVCIGANAAECHHVPDGTKWSGKEPILVDMGVRLDGVCSDLTRNLVPDTVSGEYRKVYAIVAKANRAAIAAVKAGMAAKDLDAVARKIISDAGYANCFGHSLGHGVGYEIHEAPTVSSKNPAVLEPGMVITIEPGIYLEGRLGVRIEDLVLVTQSGCKVLSR